MGRFARNKTSRPTPALTNNPASMAPVERAPSKYSSVRTTDAAQLGIRPTIAENHYGKVRIRGNERGERVFPNAVDNDFKRKRNQEYEQRDLQRMH